MFKTRSIRGFIAQRRLKNFDTRSALISIPGDQVSCMMATRITARSGGCGIVCSDPVGGREGGRRDEIAVIQ
jgi:hypothetical protein